MGENKRKTKTSLASFSFKSFLLSKIDDPLYKVFGLVFEAIPPLYNYQITITMSNLEWQNGKKTKSTKIQQKPEKFGFRNPAKISQCWEFLQSCENFATLRNFAKLRKFCKVKFHKVAKFLKLCEIPSLRKWQEFSQGLQNFLNP